MSSMSPLPVPIHRRSQDLRRCGASRPAAAGIPSDAPPSRADGDRHLEDLLAGHAACSPSSVSVRRQLSRRASTVSFPSKTRDLARPGHSRHSPSTAVTRGARPGVARDLSLLSPWDDHIPSPPRSSTRPESTSGVPSSDLTARLGRRAGDHAEGFLFELERRGYLSAGEFVPEVALEYPDALRALHVDFQRAGSGHRRGVHLQRSPREDAGHRQGGSARAAEPLRTPDRPRRRQPAPRRPHGRQHLEHQHLGPRGHRPPGRGARHIRGDGGLGRRGGRRPDHRRDVLLRRRGAGGARGRQVQRPPRRSHDRADGDGGDGRRDRHRRDLPAAGAGRRGRGGHELLPADPRRCCPGLKQDPARPCVPCHVGALPIPYRTTAEEPTFFNLSDDPRKGALACTAAPSRPRWTRSTPTGTRSVAPSPRRSTRSASTTSASAAVPLRCWSARSRRRSGSPPEASRFSENMRNHFMYGGDNEPARLSISSPSATRPSRGNTGQKVEQERAQAVDQRGAGRDDAAALVSEQLAIGLVSRSEGRTGYRSGPPCDTELNVELTRAGDKRTDALLLR